MLNLCYEDHDADGEIVFEGKNCPLCEALRLKENLQEEVRELNAQVIEAMGLEG